MATYTTTNTTNDTVSEVMSNNNSIEVIGLNGTVVKCEKVENEFGNKIKFSIYGRSIKGKSKIVGRLTVDAASNKKFIKAPGLRKSTSKRTKNTPNSLTTKLRSIEKDPNGNVIKYVYDLIYKATENSSISSGSDYTMTNVSSRDLVSIKTIIRGIDSIDCGSELIKSSTQTKTLKIKGHPKATVIIVTTTFIDSVDADGKDVGSIEEVTTPIVESKYAKPGNANYNIENTQINSPIGEVRAIRANLGVSGQYILKQKYPGVSSTTRHGIHVFPNAITDRFPVNKYSKLDGWKDFVPTVGYNGAYSKIITQYVNPRLTLSATISNTGTGGSRTVSLNGVSMTGSNSITRYYTGNYNKGHISSKKQRPLVVNESSGPQLNGGSNLELIYVTYTVLADHAIAADRRPKFSPGSVLPDNPLKVINSDWSNSEAAENGGCILDLVSYNTPVISANGGTANGKATIDLIFKVQNYGTKDVTMHIDLANLITIS
tara:strand:- start:582 stop:2045 length:1464 start_codon:yes stop_codon:yes gene_type:complete